MIGLAALAQKAPPVEILRRGSYYFSQIRCLGLFLLILLTGRYLEETINYVGLHL
jgi:hypothetical protein